ncbi:MAG: TniB family NTP-binding protein [Nitrosopumilus sp.]|nr:TniB family NTP-binding protein [Nitrosopumilus sp.]
MYGSSKQGKTTLLNKHIENKNIVKVQCDPSVTLSEIYKRILDRLNVEIQSSATNEISDSRNSKFHFNIKIPGFAEAGGEISKTVGEKESTTQIVVNVSNAQDVAELIKKYFPEKIIVLENFHYLNEQEQEAFSYDLRTFQDIDVRVIILGIWRERNRLTQYNGDLQDRIVELPVEPWENYHLMQIISLGEHSLNIDMSNVRDSILNESFGNVGVLQELCRKCCYIAGIVETGSKRNVLSEHLAKAILENVDDYASRFHRSLETLLLLNLDNLKMVVREWECRFFSYRFFFHHFTLMKLDKGYQDLI